MKKLLYFFPFLFLFISISSSQKLWQIEPQIGNYYAVGGDTSQINLRNEMMQRKSHSAALLLAFHYGETEKILVLDSLRNWAYSDTTVLQISPFYYYQMIRGFYGDTNAIHGMDTLIRYMGDNAYRLDGIELLAEAGHFDYYDTLMRIYYRGGSDSVSVISILGYYGKSPQYRSQITTLLSQLIHSSTKYNEYMPPAIALARFNLQEVVSELNGLFESSTDRDRELYFTALGIFDRNGQPERSIFGITHEQDIVSRFMYYPTPSAVEKSFSSYRYYEPKYLKFMYDRFLIEDSTIIKDWVGEFIYQFQPLVPNDSISTLTLIDSLLSYKYQVASYNWLSDSNFVNELDSLLNNARSYLLQSDSNNCYRQIKLFQQRVDEEYIDSLDGDTKSVNKEAWKFLYYNAQYILPGLRVRP